MNEIYDSIKAKLNRINTIIRAMLAKLSSLGVNTSGKEMRHIVDLLSSLPATPGVTMVDGMKLGGSLWTDIPVEMRNWELVHDGSRMLCDCVNLSADISSYRFNDAMLTNTREMFSGCTNLLYAPFMDFSHSTDAYSMFSRCTSLRYPAKNNRLVLTSATNVNFLFSSCTRLTDVSVKLAVAEQGRGMFKGCSALKSVSMEGLDNCEDYMEMFDNCEKLESISLYGCNHVGRNTAAHPSWCNLPFDDKPKLKTITLSGAASIDITPVRNQLQNLTLRRNGEYEVQEIRGFYSEQPKHYSTLIVESYSLPVKTSTIDNVWRNNYGDVQYMCSVPSDTEFVSYLNWIRGAHSNVSSLASLTFDCKYITAMCAGMTDTLSFSQFSATSTNGIKYLSDSLSLKEKVKYLRTNLFAYLHFSLLHLDNFSKLFICNNVRYVPSTHNTSDSVVSVYDDLYCVGRAYRTNWSVPANDGYTLMGYMYSLTLGGLSKVRYWEDLVITGLHIKTLELSGLTNLVGFKTSLGYSESSDAYLDSHYMPFNNNCQMKRVSLYDCTQIRDWNAMFSLLPVNVVNIGRTNGATASCKEMFRGCRIMSMFESDIKPTSAYAMFRGCEYILYFGSKTWEYINKYEDGWSFVDHYYLHNFINGHEYHQDYGNGVLWTKNTRSVSDASPAHESNVKGELGGIESLDLSELTDGRNMFADCIRLTAVNMPDMPKATNLYGLFAGCTRLETAKFGTMISANMGNMFGGCAALESVEFNGTIRPTVVRDMFRGCSSLVMVNGIIDLASLNTSVSDNTVGAMFDSTNQIRKMSLYNVGADNSAADIHLDALKSLLNASCLDILSHLADRSGKTPRRLYVPDTVYWNAAVISVGGASALSEIGYTLVKS